MSPHPVNAFNSNTGIIQPNGMPALAPQIEAVNDEFGVGAVVSNRNPANDYVRFPAIFFEGFRTIDQSRSYISEMVDTS